MFPILAWGKNKNHPKGECHAISQFFIIKQTINRFIDHCVINTVLFNRNNFCSGMYRRFQGKQDNAMQR